MGHISHTLTDTMGVLESVKAAADIHSPLTGTVKELNPSLEDNPELINEDSYNKGIDRVCIV